MKVSVKLLTGHARLHHNIKIFIMNLQNLIHFLHIDRDAAMQSSNMSLEGCAGTKRNDRHLIVRARFNDLTHFFCCMGRHHRIGRRTSVERLIFPETLTNRLCLR